MIAYDSGMAFRPNKENRRKLRKSSEVPASSRAKESAPAPRDLLREPMSLWMQDPGAAILEQYPLLGLQSPMGPMNQERAAAAAAVTGSKRDEMPEQITYRSRRQAFGEGTLHITTADDASSLDAVQNQLKYGENAAGPRLASSTGDTPTADRSASAAPMTPTADKAASADVASSGAAYVKAPSATQLGGGPSSSGNMSGAGSSGGDEHVGNIAGKRMQLKGVANLNINGIPSGELQLNLEGSGGGM